MKSGIYKEWLKGGTFFLAFFLLFYFLLISNDWHHRQADICIRQSHTSYNTDTKSIEKLEVAQEWLVFCGLKSADFQSNEFDTFTSDAKFLKEIKSNDEPSGLSVRISCTDKIKSYDSHKYISFLGNGYRLVRDFDGNICKLSQEFIFEIEKLNPRLSKSQLNYLAEKSEVISLKKDLEK